MQANRFSIPLLLRVKHPKKRIKVKILVPLGLQPYIPSLDVDSVALFSTLSIAVRLHFGSNWIRDGEEGKKTKDFCIYSRYSHVEGKRRTRYGHMRSSRATWTPGTACTSCSRVNKECPIGVVVFRISTKDFDSRD